MAASLARRGLSSLASLLILTMLVFGVSELTPGGPAATILGLHATAGGIKALNASLGLDRPFLVQYLDWWGHLLRGNLGFSFTQNQAVIDLIGQYLGNTAVLDTVALVLAVLVSIVVGLLQGALEGTWVSTLIGMVQFALYAMPIFWLGLILISVFAVGLNWLPASGAQDLAASGFDVGSYLRHLVLPATTLALVFISFFSRYMGATARLEFRQVYVTVARAKGAAPLRIATRHVLRNAVRPLITQIGLFLPWIFAGGVVVEQVFNYPGLGYLLWQSALQHDYPVLTVLTLMIGTFTIIGNLLADIVNGLLDKRVHYV